MKSTICRSCNKTVTSINNKCPNCGDSLNQMPYITIIVATFGILMFLFLFIKLGNNHPSSSNWRERSDDSMALIMMQDFVTQRLKAPSTAKFPGATEREGHVKYLGNQRYQVVSWVDAENSFGAHIRSYYAGEIEQISEDKWSLVTLVFKN